MPVIDVARMALTGMVRRSRAFMDALTAEPALDTFGILTYAQPVADKPTWGAILYASDGEDAVLAHARGNLVKLGGAARR